MEESIIQLTEILFAVNVPQDVFNPHIQEDKICFDSLIDDPKTCIDIGFPFDIVGGVDNLGKYFATSGMSEQIQEIITPKLDFKFRRLVVIEKKL
jgi:hypothetical protein